MPVAEKLEKRFQSRNEGDNPAKKNPPKQEGMPTAKIAEMNREALHQVRLILSKPDAYR